MEKVYANGPKFIILKEMNKGLKKYDIVTVGEVQINFSALNMFRE